MLLKLDKFKNFLEKWKNEKIISDSTYKEINSAINLEKETYLNTPKNTNFDFIYEIIQFKNEIFLYFQTLILELFSPILNNKKDFADQKQDDEPIENLEEINFKESSIFEELSRSFKDVKSKNLFLEKIKPLFNEYIFWVIGICLLLAGSIFGVRESFRILNETNQMVLVIFSFFVYQFLFSILGIFLNKKSDILSKGLIFITFFLLPIPFSLLGNLFILSKIKFMFLFLFLLIAYFILFKKLNLVFKSNSTNRYISFFPILVLQMLVLGLDSRFSSFAIFLGIIFFQLSNSKLETNFSNLFFKSYFILVLFILYFWKWNLTETSFNFGNFEHLVLFLSIFLFSVSLILYSEKNLKKISVELILYAVCFSFSILTLNYISSADLYFKNLKWFYFIVPLSSSYLFYNKINSYKESIHPFFILSIFSIFQFTKHLDILPKIEFFTICLIPSTLLFFQSRFLNLKETIKKYTVCIFYFSNLYFFIFENQFFFQNLITASFTLAVFFIYFGKNSILHFFNSVITFFLFYSFFRFINLTDKITLIPISFLITSILYHLIYSLKFKNTNEKLQPYLEASFIHSMISILFAFSFFNFENQYTHAVSILSVFFFFYRSFEDRTIITGFFSVLLLVLLLTKFFPLQNQTDLTSFKILYYSICSVSLILLSLFLPIQKTNSESRYFFGLIKFPFYEEGLNLFNRSISLVGFFCIFLLLHSYFKWLFIPELPERFLVILSFLFIAVLFLMLFLKKRTLFPKLRGSVFIFILALLFIGFALITNRLNRPQEPRIEGLYYTISILGLTVFTILLKKFGEKISIYLRKEKNAKTYFLVPLHLILILCVVLFFKINQFLHIDMYRFFYLTPPSLFFGIFLGILVYSRFMKLDSFFFLSNLFFIFFISLIFFQENFWGVELIQLEETNFWYPKFMESKLSAEIFLDTKLYFEEKFFDRLEIQSKFLYIILTLFLIYSIFLAVTRLKLGKEVYHYFHFKIYNLEIIFFLFLYFFFLIISIQFLSRIQEINFIILFAVSLILLNLIFKPNSILFLLTGIILLLIQMVSRFEIFPFWFGSIFSIFSILFLILSEFIAKRKNLELDLVLEYSKYAILTYLFLGIFFSFCTYQIIDKENLFSSIFRSFILGLSGNWKNNFSVSIGFFFISICSFRIYFISKKNENVLSVFYGLVFILIGSFFLVPNLIKTVFLPNLNFSEINFSSLSSYYSLNFIILALAFYFLSFESKDENFKKLYSFLKEFLFIFVLGLVFISIFLPNQNLPFSNIFNLISILVILVLSLFEAFTTRTTKSIYYSQILVPVIYLVLKLDIADSISSELENILFIVYGFILLAINKLAESKNIPQVVESTKKFLTVFILLLRAFSGNEATVMNIANDFLVSFIFFLLGNNSNSKLQFFLSSFFITFGLGDFLKLNGVNGFEVYTSITGIFILSLTHIYRESLNQTTIQALRLGGGFLLYLPSAYLICFEIGRGQDPFFAILFGLISVLGILLGMFFQIRSYVFKGTFFFILNLLVNLLQEGLRNELIGFVLLTILGLGIIFSLIYYNLRKEQTLKFIYKLRQNMKHWE